MWYRAVPGTVHVCTHLYTHTFMRLPGIFDGAKWWLFWCRPLPRKLLLALSELNVSCFTKDLKISKRISRFFCAYLHGIYDFTRLTRAIVCGEIDLCWNFESGFRRRISKKKNHDCIVVWWKNIFFEKKRVEMYYSECDKMIMMPLFNIISIM